MAMYKIFENKIDLHIHAVVSLDDTSSTLHGDQIEEGIRIKESDLLQSSNGSTSTEEKLLSEYEVSEGTVENINSSRTEKHSGVESFSRTTTHLFNDEISGKMRNNFEIPIHILAKTLDSDNSISSDKVSDEKIKSNEKNMRNNRNEILEIVPLHILDMPEMILEQIFRNLSLENISNNIRQTCRLFYYVASRILRLTFRNILIKLENAMKKLEMKPESDNVTEICSYKVLQSEFLSLRAACARQVESGKFCFIPGRTLQEYLTIIKKIQEGQITGIVCNFDRLNKIPLVYFDELYEDIYYFRNRKLFGIEVLEILDIAMNAKSDLTVIYDNFEEGSCFVNGNFKINYYTQLKNPTLKGNSMSARRKAVLMYMRHISRANNCDVAIKELKEFRNSVLNGEELSNPFLKYTQWRLKRRIRFPGGRIYERYEKILKEEKIFDCFSSDKLKSNVALECNFDFVCPKVFKPLGIQFQSNEKLESLKKNHQTLSSEFIEETLKISNWRYKTLFSALKQEEYMFKMTLNLPQLAKEENAQLGKGKLMKITEAFLVNDCGEKECGLDITSEDVSE